MMAKYGTRRYLVLQRFQMSDLALLCRVDSGDSFVIMC